jgi:hypothetical protein
MMKEPPPAAGKLQKSFARLSCPQEKFKKVFWDFPARRKSSKKFCETFLRAGKVQNSFARLSCAHERVKKISRGFPVRRKGSK